MDLKLLPKIELHLHLDCSLSYKAVARLAPHVTHEEYVRDYVAPARCTNLVDFLARAPKGFRLMQTEAALRAVTQDIFEQLVEDGVVYAEIRFAPLLHLEQGLMAERVVEVVERATEELVRATDVEAGLILCTLRHFSAEQSMETARLVDQFRGSRVVALDIAGDEAGFPLDAHVAAYRFAQERGLWRTAHAGEACGPESVWETLRLLDPQRIGHGVRSIEDARLLEHLKSEGIHLEVCPSSNVQIVPEIARWDEHPIDRLYRAGVRLNVNTDTRMLNPVTLTGEYEGLHRVFGWGAEDFLRTNLMGVEAAFVSREVKERLRKRVCEGMESLQGKVDGIMEVAEIMSRFEKFTKRFEREAVDAAIARKDEVTPELLRVLERIGDPEEAERLDAEGGHMAHLYAMYLLAQFRETRAFPLVLRIARLDGELLESLFGDFITDGLEKVFASVCGGQIDEIQSIVEDAELDEWARIAALTSLVSLVSAGIRSREEVLGYFTSLFRGRLADKNEMVWSFLVADCVDLYAPDLIGDIERAYAEGLVDLEVIGPREVREDLSKGEAWALERLASNPHRRLVDDTVREMAWWACFQEEEEPRVDRSLDSVDPIYGSWNVPYRREGPKIGRNDPCPCGSGKKYKKCCGG